MGVLATAGLAGVAAWWAPHWLLVVCSKEGLAEVVAQVFLLVAVLGWAWIRTRDGAGAGWVALAGAVVLAEELDWGAQLGWTAVVELVGTPNLHNAFGGASYLVFAVPWVVLYGAALRGVASPAWVPPRLDGVAFGLVVLTAGLSLLVSNAWEQALDELSELMLYVLMAASGTRSARLELKRDQTAGPSGAFTGAVDGAEVCFSLRKGLGEHRDLGGVELLCGARRATPKVDVASAIEGADAEASVKRSVLVRALGVDGQADDAADVPVLIGQCGLNGQQGRGEQGGHGGDGRHGAEHEVPGGQRSHGRGA